MAKQIAVRIPDDALAAVDIAITTGRFESRAAAVREGLERLLADEREIAEDYRRGLLDATRGRGDRSGRSDAHGGVDRRPRARICPAPVTSLIDRGDVFDADVAEAGPHPVGVVSRQSAIPVRSKVTVALVTSVVRGHPAEGSLGPEHGLERESVANCDEIHAVRKDRLTRRRGSVGLQRMGAVEGALRLSLGL